MTVMLYRRWVIWVVGIIGWGLVVYGGAVGSPPLSAIGGVCIGFTFGVLKLAGTIRRLTREHLAVELGEDYSPPEARWLGADSGENAVREKLMGARVMAVEQVIDRAEGDTLSLTLDDDTIVTIRAERLHLGLADEGMGTKGEWRP